jgi:hypothetical protein
VCTGFNIDFLRPRIGLQPLSLRRINDWRPSCSISGNGQNAAVSEKSSRHAIQGRSRRCRGKGPGRPKKHWTPMCRAANTTMNGINSCRMRSGSLGRSLLTRCPNYGLLWFRGNLRSVPENPDATPSTTVKRVLQEASVRLVIAELAPMSERLHPPCSPVLGGFRVRAEVPAVLLRSCSCAVIARERESQHMNQGVCSERAKETVV